MKIGIYESCPKCAREIREEVFLREQGFQKEFDEIDAVAVHLVLFGEDGTAAATCRVFWNTEMDSYTLGRLAVMKAYRGRKLGSAIMEEAEKYVQNKGGKSLILHAQCQVTGFYKKLGYAEFGSIENEEGCPHVWMRKVLPAEVDGSR